MVDKVQQEDAKMAKSIKLNAETYEGVRFHTLALPAPEKLAPMVGTTLDVVLGIADDKLLVAAGRDAAKTLKKVLDESKVAAGKEVMPLRIVVAPKPVAKLIAQTAEDEQAAAAAAGLAEALADAGSKDHVTFTAQPVAQGVRLRLEVEEGLLKALATTAQMGPDDAGAGEPCSTPHSTAVETGPAAAQLERCRVLTTSSGAPRRHATPGRAFSVAQALTPVEARPESNFVFPVGPVHGAVVCFWRRSTRIAKSRRLKAARGKKKVGTIVPPSQALNAWARENNHLHAICLSHRNCRRLRGRTGPASSARPRSSMMRP